MNLTSERKELLDILAQKIRLEGYQVISRKFGKYLPAPPRVGVYEIDLLAKRSNKLVIGLALTSEDFRRDDLKEKITFLATRTSRYANLPVLLFVGVDQSLYVKLAQVLQQIPAEVKRNIRSVPVAAEPAPTLFVNLQHENRQRNYFN